MSYAFLWCWLFPSLVLGWDFCYDCAGSCRCISFTLHQRLNDRLFTKSLVVYPLVLFISHLTLPVNPCIHMQKGRFHESVAPHMFPCVAW